MTSSRMTFQRLLERAREQQEVLLGKECHVAVFEDDTRVNYYLWVIQENVDGGQEIH